MSSISKQSPRSRRPTIADVARLAGVNKSSVSRVLNLSPDEFNLTEETRQRVLRAVEELGYRANWQAKAFHQGRTQIIGLAFGQYLPAMYGVNEPIIRACSEKLIAAGYHLVFIPGTDDADNLVLERRVDGCIVVEELSPRFRELLIKENMPTVLVNVDSDAPFPQVQPDDLAGGRIATQHLIDLGHRRIVFYMRAHDNQNHFSVRERVAAYKEVMLEAGAYDFIHVEAAVADDFVARLRPGRGGPTAIVAHNHLDALHLLHALWSHGIGVPHDVSVICFNDVYPTQVAIPPLTAMSVPASEMGQRAVDLLFRSMDQQSAETAAGIEKIRLPEKLVLRQSTGPVPG